MCMKDELIKQLRNDFNRMSSRRSEALLELKELKDIISEFQERLADQEAIVQAAFWFFCPNNETEESKRKTLHDAVKRWFSGVKDG